jgi:hypothetical protein
MRTIIFPPRFSLQYDMENIWLNFSCVVSSEKIYEKRKEVEFFWDLWLKKRLVCVR